LAIVHRDLIISLANRHRLPAVYSNRHFVTGGGLISYGPDTIDPFRRAAGYVDRILKGEKAAQLPVAPTLALRLATIKFIAKGGRERALNVLRGHSADSRCQGWIVSLAK
jgi:putative tryptophan/tyrosine transport system substrate-binding protein